MISLTGIWHIELEAGAGTKRVKQSGDIELPGILQAQGYGNDIDYDTPWVSSLHDGCWYEREEYKYAQENGVNVPFLAQPPKHFIGRARYSREIEITDEANDTYYLYIECTRWRTTLYVDGEMKGGDCSLCTAHCISCGTLEKGTHLIEVDVDNSMQYPYRPDGHCVSDALGATWNGMVGEIALFTESELKKREMERQFYAKEHPRKIEIKNGKFYVDGKPEYFRGTHFGGDYPLTGYPETDKAWWTEKLRVIKAWGFNFVRCHSYCPPEAAFAAADEEGIYLQPECGMWNYFAEDIPMLDVLREETRRILTQFGHHPSFVLFSPTNEPAGDWYKVLRRWVEETRAFDEELGYKGRRAYTAQSGWFYDVSPSKIEGVDYIYFHRTAYAPYLGCNIRGDAGWRGGDYEPSLSGVRLPVICHEMGQWCAYPDFSVADKFTGYLRAGNYAVFRENCRAHGLLPLNKEFAYASGRNQLRLYKEDIEANLRTRGIYGFEMLDLHDYTGQGTALVGLLDAFWQEKGYANADEFRQFCNETVLLAAFKGYVYTTEQDIEVPISVCHFGKNEIRECAVKWELFSENDLIEAGELAADRIACGENTALGTVRLDMERIKRYLRRNGSRLFTFKLSLAEITNNSWEFSIFDEESISCTAKGVVRYTKDWDAAKKALRQGQSVVFTPYLSDMDYECPPLSMKNVFWNSQMGPSWGRSLGMIADTDCPLFKKFPTDVSGGWQWEDILSHARGFHLKGNAMQSLKPIVRVIDDWNRNLPLALILEARVGNGKLLLASADLEGGFEERPSACALKNALLAYAASADFAPKLSVDESDIEASLFPVMRMGELAVGVSCGEGEEISDAGALVEVSPNTVTQITGASFPVELTVSLKKQVKLRGLLYVPEQRERERDAFPKETSVFVRSGVDDVWREVGRFTLKNSSLSQKILFDKTYAASAFRFVIYSTYGNPNANVWEEYGEGYRLTANNKNTNVRVKIACLHILCDNDNELDGVNNDRIFWGERQSSATKEIET